MYRLLPIGYYKTPGWKRKAYECKRLRGFACAACGRKFKPWEHFKLEAHHDDAAYAKVPNENPEDLVPLCGKLSGKPCHKKGRYTRWEIGQDRTAHGFIRLVDWLFGLPGRLLERLARKRATAPRPKG